MTRKSIWDEVRIDPELRDHITLSPKDVADFTMEAMRWHNPAARLADLLNERGRQRRDALNAHYQERQKQDAARIRDVGHWPRSHLSLKTQPWVAAAEGGRTRFALIHCNDLLEVIEQGKPPVEFESIEELVKVWSVD